MSQGKVQTADKGDNKSVLIFDKSDRKSVV